jgi:hypothetical protein
VREQDRVGDVERVRAAMVPASVGVRGRRGSGERFDRSVGGRRCYLAGRVAVKGDGRADEQPGYEECAEDRMSRIDGDARSQKPQSITGVSRPASANGRKTLRGRLRSREDRNESVNECTAYGLVRRPTNWLVVT